MHGALRGRLLVRRRLDVGAAKPLHDPGVLLPRRKPRPAALPCRERGRALLFLLAQYTGGHALYFSRETSASPSSRFVALQPTQGFTCDGFINTP